MSEFSYSNVKREMEVYGYDSVVKSHCRMCHGGCGVYVYVKDGKAVKIAPLTTEHCVQKESHPSSSLTTLTASPTLCEGWGQREVGNGSVSHGMKPWIPFRKKYLITKKALVLNP